MSGRGPDVGRRLQAFLHVLHGVRRKRSVLRAILLLRMLRWHRPRALTIAIACVASPGPPSGVDSQCGQVEKNHLLDMYAFSSSLCNAFLFLRTSDPQLGLQGRVALTRCLRSHRHTQLRQHGPLEQLRLVLAGELLIGSVVPPVPASGLPGHDPVATDPGPGPGFSDPAPA